MQTSHLPSVSTGTSSSLKQTVGYEKYNSSFAASSHDPNIHYLASSACHSDEPSSTTSHTPATMRNGYTPNGPGPDMNRTPMPKHMSQNMGRILPDQSAFIDSGRTSRTAKSTPQCPPTPQRTPFYMKPGPKLLRQNSLTDTRALLDDSGTESPSAAPHQQVSWAESFSQEAIIGSGSFSIVYKARSMEDNLHYAVKRTRRPFRSRGDRTSILREFRVSQQLGNHPNILHYKLAWQEQGLIYMQMELCEHGNFSSVADKYGKYIPEVSLWRFIHSVAKALSHIHAKGMVHLDVKPENILVARDGCLKLGDLGLVKYVANRHATPQLHPTEISATSRISHFDLDKSAVSTQKKSIINCGPSGASKTPHQMMRSRARCLSNAPATADTIARVATRSRVEDCSSNAEPSNWRKLFQVHDDLAESGEPLSMQDLSTNETEGSKAPSGNALSQSLNILDDSHLVNRTISDGDVPFEDLDVSELSHISDNTRPSNDNHCARIEREASELSSIAPSMFGEPIGISASMMSIASTGDDEEGDVRYMAFELLTPGQCRPPADIFSLGLSTMELTWGAPLPVEGEAWHAVRKGQLPPLPEWMQPASLDQCLETAMKLDTSVDGPKPTVSLHALWQTDRPAPQDAQLFRRSNELLLLIQRMTDPKPENRPTATEVLLIAERNIAPLHQDPVLRPIIRAHQEESQSSFKLRPTPQPTDEVIPPSTIRHGAHASRTSAFDRHLHSAVRSDAHAANTRAQFPDGSRTSPNAKQYPKTSFTHGAGGCNSPSKLKSSQVFPQTAFVSRFQRSDSLSPETHRFQGLAKQLEFSSESHGSSNASTIESKNSFVPTQSTPSTTPTKFVQPTPNPASPMQRSYRDAVHGQRTSIPNGEHRPDHTLASTYSTRKVPATPLPTSRRSTQTGRPTSGRQCRSVRQFTGMKSQRSGRISPATPTDFQGNLDPVAMEKMFGISGNNLNNRFNDAGSTTPTSTRDRDTTLEPLSTSKRFGALSLDCSRESENGAPRKISPVKVMSVNANSNRPHAGPQSPRSRRLAECENQTDHQTEQASDEQAPMKQVRQRHIGEVSTASTIYEDDSFLVPSLDLRECTGDQPGLFSALNSERSWADVVTSPPALVSSHHSSESPTMGQTLRRPSWPHINIPSAGLAQAHSYHLKDSPNPGRISPGLQNIRPPQNIRFVRANSGSPSPRCETPNQPVTYMWGA